MITNIIEIELLPADRVVTRPVHQWDIGQIIKVTDAEIEDGTPVDFGNRFMKGGLRAYVINNQVTIPAPALQQERDLTGYVVITDENSETTVKEIAIPVIARPKPEDYVDEEIRESTEFQYVLQAVGEVEADAKAAAEAAGKAAGSETAAADAKQAAENAASAAAGSANSADSSAKAAAVSETAASGAATTATGKATEAGDSAAKAKVSETNAATSEKNAKTYQDSAAQSATNAGNSATAAGKSATNAAASAAAAEAARKTAEDAIVGVGEAITAANEAKAAATNAVESATAAGNSETAADTSAKNAAASEQAAGNSATAAGNSATAAGKSATNAAASEAAAKTAAGIAETKAQEATASALDALTSKRTAVDAATEAADSAAASIEILGATQTTKKELEQKIDGLASEDYVESKIADLKAQAVQNTPLFAKTVEECTDTTKLYVIPDALEPEKGYVCSYGTVKETIENTEVISGKVAVVLNKRYSHSGQEYKESNGYSCVIVPIESTGASQVHTIAGISKTSYWNGLYCGLANTAFETDISQTITDNSDPFSFTKVPQGKYYVLYHTKTTSGFTTLTVDGVEMEVVVSSDGSAAKHSVVTTTTETVGTAKWINTGIVYGANIAVDSVLSSVSTNPVQSKVVKAELEKIDEKVEKIKVSTTNMASHIATVLAPPQNPADGTTTADVDLTTCNSDDIHGLLNDVVARYPNYITREMMGKDESGQFDIYRYTLGKSTYKAWQKENYPKMYAWKNGSTIIYSLSVSPRIGETMYSTKYIGTAYGTVTAVNATNRSRTVNGLEFVRSASNDVAPTLKYVRDVVYGDTLTSNGVTYHRYPFGDADKDYKKRIPITIIANEHGGHEVRDCALIVTRLIKDLCEGKNQDNPVLNYIRENVSLTVIPIVNPYGWNMYMNTNGYRNYNDVNINRNYDTVGWDYCYNNQSVDGNDKLGEYAGSENETQYVMNTMSESGAVIAMSVHGLSTTADSNATYYQGQNPNGAFSEVKTALIHEELVCRYGLVFKAYNPLECPPDTTAKSPSYITQIGAYGGIIEFNCNDSQLTEEEATATGKQRRYTAWTMEQQYTLLLKFLAMWISDYEEQV